MFLLRIGRGLILFNFDTRAFDTRAFDTRAIDTGAIDTGAIDTGAIDTGAIDTGAIDTGAIDVGAVRAAISYCMYRATLSNRRTVLAGSVAPPVVAQLP